MFNKEKALVRAFSRHCKIFVWFVESSNRYFAFC